MTDLGAIARNAGLTVEDHWVPDSPGSFHPIGVMIHHTASSATGNRDLPSLKVVTQGRGGAHPLPPPLCNFLVGRHATIAGIAHGRANDSGTGKRAVIDRILGGQEPIPASQVPGMEGYGGSAWFYDIEVENNGIGEPYPVVQMEAVVALTRALCIHHQWNPIHRVLGHKEWTTRKIDPSFDMSWFRRQVAKITTPIDPEDEMTPAQEKRVVDLLTSIQSTVRNQDKVLEEQDKEIKALKLKAERADRFIIGTLVAEGDIDPTNVPFEIREHAKAIDKNYPGEGYNRLLQGPAR